MRFIDRSNVNGTDDYGAAGVGYLYLKATEGTSFVDSTYAARRKQAASQGVHHIGAYHFADLDDPHAEAAHFLSVIGKPRGGDLRPCLDLERGKVVTDIPWAEAFVTSVESALGYRPVIYGSTSLLYSMRNASRILRDCPWWRAEYGTNNGTCQPLAGGPLGASAHQYTSVASFPGIAGATDASVMLDTRRMLVPIHYQAIVETGGGERFVYKQGGLWRTRACAKALSLLRSGTKDLTIKVVEQ